MSARDDDDREALREHGQDRPANIPDAPVEAGRADPPRDDPPGEERRLLAEPNDRPEPEPAEERPSRTPRLEDAERADRDSGVPRARASHATMAEARRASREPPPPPPVTRSPLRRFTTASARARLGRASLLVVALFALLAVFADFFASDLPIVGRIQGRLWLLPNVTQPAALTRLSPDERGRATAWSFGPLVHHGPLTVDPSPSAILRRPLALDGHPLGTDLRGRDVFARVVHGTRSYLLFAFAAVLFSLLLGGVAGGTAGMFGGPLDVFVGRVIETISAFPSLVLILGIQAAVPEASQITLFLAIALTRLPEVARLVRADVIGVATREYVMAARALGASPWRVLRRHVVPNVRGQFVVLAGFGIPAVILIEASLDFLRVGGGVPLGDATPGRSAALVPDVLRAASWGETMSQFRDASHAWWLLACPGIPLFLLVVALNLAAEARREALDPHAL